MKKSCSSVVRQKKKKFNIARNETAGELLETAGCFGLGLHEVATSPYAPSRVHELKSKTHHNKR